MKPTWILIANAAHARLLQQEPAGRLLMLQSVEHPASRMRSSELGDAEAGRQLSDRAEGQCCNAVHLFSSSPFLGELKHALGPATRRLLAGTHDVDLTAVGLTELPARLEHELT